MLDGVRSWTVFDWRKVVMAAVAGAAVLGATGAAQADDDWKGWKKAKRYYAPYYYAPAPVVVAPRYYAPPPVVYAPPPVVYAPPVAYAPAPVYYPPPGVSINIPLR